LTIKGAPDVLIGRCSKIVGIDGRVQTFTASERNGIEQIKNDWSSKGKRVILLARKVVKKNNSRSLPSSGQFEKEVTEHANSDLVLVGLVAIVDPPRDEIPEVVRILRGAGIRIFMVCFKQ
jgi:sodium/potassium-transporting ATPase subunit alpha